MISQWPMLRLGEVLTQNTTYIEVPEFRPYPKLSVRLYGKGVVLDAPTDGVSLRMKRHQLAKAGDVILSEIWGKKGAIGFVPPEGEGALCTSHFFLFGVRTDRVDSGYLDWIFKANYLQEQLDAEAKGTTGYAAIRPKHLLGCEIPLPPLAEQRRIVARIEGLSEQIEEAQHVQRDAAQEAQALSVAIISGLADTWKANAVTVRELVGQNGLQNGLSVKSADGESEVRCLTLSAMRNGRIDLRRSKAVPLFLGAAAPFIIGKGEVFIVRGNGSKHLCGRAGLVADDGEGTIFPDLFIRVALPSDRMIPELFVAVWNSPSTRAFIEEKAKTTSGIWKINQGHILSTPIPVPPMPEQHEVLSKLNTLQTEVSTLTQSQSNIAAELDALLPAILDRAFRGEL